MEKNLEKNERYKKRLLGQADFQFFVKKLKPLQPNWSENVNYFNINTTTTTMKISKLEKLSNLLQNSKLSGNSIVPPGGLVLPNWKMDTPNGVLDFSQNFSFYLSLLEKPVNLLFSIDQFFFEFSKKQYQQRKTGEFLQQLKQRKKFTLFYGHLTQKQLINLWNTSKKYGGNFSKNVFSQLESRLDVLLYRSGVYQTINQARQSIKHKKILVNKIPINIPSFCVHPGDVISMCPQTFKNLINQHLQGAETLSPKWENTWMSTTVQDLFLDLLHQSPPKRISEWKKIRGFHQKDFWWTKNHSNFLEGSVSRQIGLKKRVDKNPSNRIHFQSLCGFLTQQVCRKIWDRCFLNFQDSLPLSSPPGNLVEQNSPPPPKGFLVGRGGATFNMRRKGEEGWSRNGPTKTILMMLKWKFFSKKDEILLHQKERFQAKPNFLYANGGSRQKKPQLWNLGSVGMKKKLIARIPSLRSHALSFPPKRFLVDKNPFGGKDSLKNRKHPFDPQKTYTKDTKKSVLWRKNFLIFCKFVERTPVFKNLLLLHLKKSFWQGGRKYNSFSPNFSFQKFKPIHLEIAYSIFNIIYLYPPQRINFPFYIDVDLISRSLR